MQCNRENNYRCTGNCFCVATIFIQCKSVRKNHKAKAVVSAQRVKIPDPRFIVLYICTEKHTVQRKNYRFVRWIDLAIKLVFLECRRYNKSEIKSKYIFYETGVFTIL